MVFFLCGFSKCGVILFYQVSRSLVGKHHQGLVMVIKKSNFIKSKIVLKFMFFNWLKVSAFKVRILDIIHVGSVLSADVNFHAILHHHRFSMSHINTFV